VNGKISVNSAYAEEENQKIQTGRFPLFGKQPDKKQRQIKQKNKREKQT
jgi:hypothetical protein